MNPIALLSSHSNIIPLCTKYALWDDNRTNFVVGINPITLTNLIVNITGDKNCNNWDFAKNGVINVFDQNIVANSELAALAVVIFWGRRKFAELIVDSIFKQLKDEKANIGWIKWIKGGIVMSITVVVF